MAKAGPLNNRGVQLKSLFIMAIEEKTLRLQDYGQRI